MILKENGQRQKYTEEQRHNMNKIRWLTNRYLKHYKIQRPACQICGAIKTQIHHPDYNKAFFVNFLCLKCHSDVTFRERVSPDPVDITLLNMKKDRKIYVAPDPLETRILKFTKAFAQTLKVKENKRYLMTVTEFIKEMQIHRNTAYKWIKNGLPVLHYGKTIRINYQDAIEWMEANHADKTGTAKTHACQVAGKAVHTQAQDYTATVPAMRQTGGTTASS